jgi:tRNA U55 pseudouridine synthase TruB
LGTVGHLAALVRPRSGPFVLADAVTMPDLAEATAAEAGHPWEEVLLRRGGGARIPWRRRDEVLGWIRDRMIPALSALAHLPTLDLPASEARRIRQGGAPPAPPPGVAEGGRYLLVAGPQVLAVAERGSRGPALIKVLDDEGRP